MGNSYQFSLSEAAKEADVNRTTILRRINAGKLSAQKDDNGQWKIDPAELYRVYPKRSSEEGSAKSDAYSVQSDAKQRAATVETSETLALIRQMVDATHSAKNEEIQRLEDTIEDLRNRLDKESAQNRALTQMITDGRERDASQKKRFWVRLFG